MKLTTLKTEKATRRHDRSIQIYEQEVQCCVDYLEMLPRYAAVGMMLKKKETAIGSEELISFWS